MIPVLTITLNPALDVATHVAEVRPDVKLRCTAPRVDPGGGGINVARAIRILGGEARAFVALGGATGQWVSETMTQAGIEHVVFPAPGDTRESLTVTEDSTGHQFRFMLPGAAWSTETVKQAIGMISTRRQDGGIAVLSGSMPPGAPDDMPARVQAVLNGRTRLVVDTSGPALARLVSDPAPGLCVLRLGAHEAETLAGHPLPDRHAAAGFAAALVARGVAETVIVARRAEGSVLADGEGRLFSPAAKVEVRSKVGAGDSFVAAYVLALARGEARDCALAQGVAAASAAVMTEATELCRRADVERLVAECRAVPL